MFAEVHRYKRESFRGTGFAPRVLADNGIPVVMKVRLLHRGIIFLCSCTVTVRPSYSQQPVSDV